MRALDQETIDRAVDAAQGVNALDRAVDDQIAPRSAAHRHDDLEGV
jgi:hypothetical protein